MARRRRPTEATDRALKLARVRIHAACAFVNGPVDGAPGQLNAALENPEGGFAITAALEELAWPELCAAAAAVDAALGGRPGLIGYVDGLCAEAAEDVGRMART